tara:strand:- start:679 stop:2235 length:1557 start_codon:yes stop_codon:yes gene_type:complete
MRRESSTAQQSLSSMKVTEADSTEKLPAMEKLVDMADLKRKSVRGGMVTMVSQAITIGIQLTSTVILARLLSPEDYGVLAMVMAVTAFAGIFREMGLSSAAIQKKGLTREQQSNLFWLNLAMGIILTVIVAGASPLVAWFYGKPELVAVTLALSLNFIISSLSTQHGAMLIRNMQFGRKAVATIAGSLVTLAVAIILALQGYSYWALVWGMLAGALVTSLLTLYLSPFRLGLPSKGSGIRDMLGFGANVTGFDFVNYFARNLDNILIGRVWGTIELGYYTKAYQLMLFPINAIRGPINQVAFPALSRLKDNETEFRNYFLSIISIIAYLTMPICAFLWCGSTILIDLILGPQWSEVGTLISWLAIAAFIQPVAGMSGSLLLSLGLSRRYLLCGLCNAIIFSVCFMIGVNWGAKGVAISYVITNYVILFPWLTWAFKGTPVNFKSFSIACMYPAVVSIFAFVVTEITFNHYLIESSIMGLIFMGLVFYSIVGLGYLVNKDVRRTFGRLLKKLRRLAHRL